MYRNLLGADSSISVLIEQSDPKDYAVEEGAQVLLKFLEAQRFAKSSFRELPKAFDTFFDQTHFERKGEEPMAAFCTAMEVAKRNLEEVDPDTKISSNELGYHTLKRSGLDKDERNLVIARADETFDLGKISTTLKNLFPRGGGKHRGQGARPGWRQWAMQALDESGHADEEDPPGEYWVQDDDGYWYEWDDEYGVYACEDAGEDDWGSSDMFYIEDDADTFLAGEDDDYYQTLVTLRESRHKMNKLRAARGFFKGRIDGVVDESAAAGGKSAGKGFKGKGKDKNKSKEKRCTNCGRMDHDTPNCPTGNQRPTKGKFSRGKGKGVKGAPRPRRLGLWTMATLVCVIPGSASFLQQVIAAGTEVDSKNIQTTEAPYEIMTVDVDSDPIVPEMPELEVMVSSDVVPASLVDSGATVAVAGRGWLDKIAKELAKYGLKPIIVEASQKFKGLGGARRESKQKWIIPIGIGRKHLLQEYFEIPGDMIGLTSKKNLAEWKTNLYMREEGQWADFQELDVYDKELLKLPGGHAGIDIFDYDLESYEAEPLFEKFRINAVSYEPEVFLVAETLQEFKPDFKVKEDAGLWVAEALRNGNKGIFKKNTLKRIDELMKEYQVIFDVLRDNQETFLWELFAKEARFTRAVSKGGHAHATPSDLSVGVNFNDPQTCSDFLFMIGVFKPWMVSVAFPCRAHSNMQEFQRAQGMGDWVNDMIEEFRPLINFSADVLRLQAEGGRIGIGENPLTSQA